MRNCALVFGLFLAVTSCSTGVCPTVVHSAVQAQTKVSDGFRALDQASAMAQSIPMTDAMREDLGKEITRAFKVLAEVNTILAATVPACNEPNLQDKFTAFNEAWSAIKSIFLMFSERAGASVGATGVAIPDPVFYLEQP